MANPLQFKPVVDPKLELQRRLDAAPAEHAEALIVAYDLLQAAHDQGLLDLLNGAVSGKDTILAKLAEYAKLPEGVAGIRNLIAVLKILSTLDPDVLDSLSKGMVTAFEEHRREQKPPSLWRLFRRSTDADSRRGLSFLTGLLSALGRAVKR